LVGWGEESGRSFARSDPVRTEAAETRSGNIMPRILRKIAEDEDGNLGDTSTLADPVVVDDLVNNRQNKKAAKAGA
jgi:acetyl-CoA synthetase